MIVCQNFGNISSEYKLPPKKTIGVITKEGIIDICSKFLLIKPIKKPNKAKVNETRTNKKALKLDVELEHQQKIRTLKKLLIPQLKF